MQTLIPIQSDAMCHTFQVRWPIPVGAKSAFTSGPGGNGSVSSIMEGCPVMARSSRAQRALERPAREHRDELAPVRGGCVDVGGGVHVARGRGVGCGP